MTERQRKYLWGKGKIKELRNFKKEKLVFISSVEKKNISFPK